jgi:hypothetical protein
MTCRPDLVASDPRNFLWLAFAAPQVAAAGLGWVTTVLHWLFVALQLAAAASTYSRRGS